MNNDDSLALSKVVLYKHGVGYFERRGEVTGPCQINLVCEAEAIDDMLKSILVLSSGGKIDSVTYESSKTLESRLAEFGFDLRQGAGLADLFNQIRGIPVTVAVSGESLSGRVLGTDRADTIVGPDKICAEEQVIVYTPEGVLKRIGFASISSIKIDDTSMAEEFKQQLELLFQNAKKKDRKSLSVAISSEGKQDLLIAYSIPCPIWKTSYRLMINDAARVMLQGMAIVDNVQEEDWSQVQIVLVSAAPISFIQSLYDPVQPSRPRIAPQGHSSAAPILAERAARLEQAPMAKMRARRQDAPAAQAAMAPGSYGSTDAWGGAGLEEAFSEELSVGTMLSDSFTQNIEVSTSDTGELFEYRISKAVSIPRNSSALIPIVQQDIDGERISLYNQAKNAKFPHSAIRFTNNTGLTLEGGPVTVMEGDVYAGEALLDTVKPDDVRYIIYAVDQSCPVIVREKSNSLPHWRIRALGGLIYVDYKVVKEKTYLLENLSANKKTVYLEHPLISGWNLVSELKPKETTQNFHRFCLDLEAKSSASLEVKEETDSCEQFWIAEPQQIDQPRFNWLMAQNFADDKFKAFLDKLFTQHVEIQDLHAQVIEQQQLLKQASDDQARARENLKTLGSSNERYRKELDNSEDRIARANLHLQDLQKQVKAAIDRYRKLARENFVSELTAKAQGH